MEPNTIKHLADAAAALKAAKASTKEGFCDDHCDNALAEVRRALHVVCGPDGGDVAEDRLQTLEFAVNEVRPHFDAWVRLLEEHRASLPPDSPPTPENDGVSDRSYVEHELQAMKRDLGALLDL